jgi:hypothetical protein
MPRVNQIEASVGENHAPPIAVFRPQLDNQFVFGDHLTHARNILRTSLPRRRKTATPQQSYHASFSRMTTRYRARCRGRRFGRRFGEGFGEKCRA